MCLQWCHVQRWLIDNDQECIGCERGVARDLPPEWSCAECLHLLRPAGAPLSCALTRARLPLLGRCCHWQAALALEEASALAPWLEDAVRELRATLPGWDDLSVPLVYGVPAGAWAEAIELDDCESPGEPLDTQRRAAIEAAIEAGEHGGSVLQWAMHALDAALAPAGELGLPPAWRAIVAELRQMQAPRSGEQE